MRLTNYEIEKATNHRRRLPNCVCGSYNVKVAPVIVDMLVQGSKIVENDYMLFSMIAMQCESCKRIEFFNKNILNLESTNDTEGNTGSAPENDEQGATTSTGQES